MDIASYADLLRAARMQPEPQRLLFVFTAAELPDNPGAAEKARFLAGEGGALAPVVCVDKLPEEADDFSGLAEEARRTGQKWDIVFVAGMAGRAGIAPSSDEAEQPLLLMVEAVRSGHIGNFAAFNRAGEAVRLTPAGVK